MKVDIRTGLPLESIQNAKEAKKAEEVTMEIKSASDLQGWIVELTGENFLAVYDVVLDIKQALQLSNDVIIPLLQPIVKFSVLMPGDGVNMRDRYCEFRWKATGLLKDQNAIIDFKLLRGLHRWESRLRIMLHRDRFLAFAQIMDSEYKKRTVTKLEDRSQEIAEGIIQRDPLEEIRRLVFRFHAVVIQLRQRHDNRPTLDVADEYDVQDLLHTLLILEFDDVRPEEWTPSYAGKASRVDFLLKAQQVVIEVKKTRLGLGAKEVGDQLILDIERYSKIADCKTLVCMVYDPENRILNPGGLEADLTGQKGKMKVEVIVVPKRY